MNMKQHIHQVLIEENPFTLVPDTQSRRIYYDDVSVNITLSINDITYNKTLTRDKAIDIIKEELHREFGTDLNTNAVNAVCIRIIPMLVSDESKEEFYNG